MKPNDLPSATPWTLARRAARMNPSVIREILKITEKPGIISFAGGLPSSKTFPVSEFATACAEVLGTDGRAALQYAASEGYGPLTQMVPIACPGTWTRPRCSLPPARSRGWTWWPRY
jgi:2-aminoadipate transaminase